MSTITTIAAAATAPLSTTLKKPSNSLRTVPTNLTYLSPTLTAKPWFRSTAAPGEPATNIQTQTYPAVITDVRGYEDEFSLDKNGFELSTHKTTPEIIEYLRNNQDDLIKENYYPQIEQLLKDRTGADRVLIFDHTIRKRIEGLEANGGGPIGARQPALRVHVDQTPKASFGRVKYHLPDEAEELLKGRVQIINVWRPLKGPLLDHPLAVADYRSVSQEDLVPTDLIYPDRVGETYSVRHNPGHKWYYWSGMGVDEVLFIKCFDSKEDRARLTPHTAFEDPTTPKSAAPRESVEIRALVFHTQNRQ